MKTRGIVIAGLAGGSGKSVVSVGITACLARQGVKVVTFKKGPDYIDAGWLALASASPCYNLDPYLMDEDALLDSFRSHSLGAEMVIVEGNRGVYDGVNASGGYSTAELALSLRLPVILVVNCMKSTRTVAALVLGCRMLDERLDIRGVILNNVATQRQKRIVTEAVEKYAGVPVLGVVPRMKRDIFPMRHLGMIPHQEYSGSDRAILDLADIMSDSVDIERLRNAAAEIDLRPSVQKSEEKARPRNETVRIGVIQDAAFQFYYAENLEALEAQGAVLVPVNALEDKSLPELDGLYIGGGFPETSAKELAENNDFKQSLRRAADDGLPIYAECGGLIYLGESIQLGGQEYPLTGVFPVRFGMSEKPQAHGYSIFVVDTENRFYAKGSEVKGHEFRYSTVLEWRGNTEDLAFQLKRGTGFDGGRDGLVHKNVLALYTHVHVCGTPEWAERFITLCREWKQTREVENRPAR